MKNHITKWLLAVLCLLSLKSYAQFDPTHVYKIIDPATGYCMEIGGGGNLQAEGTDDLASIRANLWGYWGGANQQWMFQQASTSDGRLGYRIVNRNSRKVLTIPRIYPTPRDESYGYSHRFATQQGAIDYNDAQIWFFTPQANGQYNITLSVSLRPLVGNWNARNNNTQMERTEVYLDMDGAGVQPWTIIDVSANMSNNYNASAFQIVNDYTGKALTVEPTSETDRNVKQLTTGNLAAGEWTIVPSSTTPGYYYIVSRRNGLVLEIGGGNTNNGASVNVWENYQHPWQEWAFLDINNSAILTPNQFLDGRQVQIFNRYAGKSLEIASGRTDDGAPAITWVGEGQPWHKWRIRFSGYNRVAAPPTLASTAPTTTSPVTASAKQQAAGVALYPNPVTSKLSITALGDFTLTSSTIRLTDMRGSEIKAAYQGGLLDVSTLASGLYLLTISDGKQIIRQRFTKL